MAELILFHHAQGLTGGVRAFADDLRAAGHVVHLPDLYEGKTFGTLADGMAHAEQLGFDTVIERGRAAADGLPDELVYAGMSLGVLPAQALAQNRPGARGALLLHGCVPPSEFGGWPDGVPVQIHLMEDDEVGAEDLEVARAFDGAELFLYPGTTHLFTDRSLPDHDEAAAALLVERVRHFLDSRGGGL
jgi:dienelactone hydrolase